MAGADKGELRRLIHAYEAEAQRHRDEALQAKAKANAFRELLQRRTDSDSADNGGQKSQGTASPAGGGDSAAKGTRRRNTHGNQHGGAGG